MITRTTVVCGKQRKLLEKVTDSVISECANVSANVAVFCGAVEDVVIAVLVVSRMVFRCQLCGFNQTI